MNHLLRKLFALVGLLASVSAFGQVIAGDSWQAAAVTPSSGGGLSAIAAYSLLSNNTSGSAVPTATQQLIIGTPSFTDTGIATQFTQSVAGYYQHILMNTSTATNASADYIVGGNLMTATTYYGDFGMNSSTFTGTGSFNLANAVYLYSNSGDLVIGTQTANAIHFVVGSSTASDAVTISATGNVSVASTTASTSTTTGAIIDAGGLGVAGSLYAGGGYSQFTGATNSVSNLEILAINNSANLSLSNTAGVNGSNNQIRFYRSGGVNTSGVEYASILGQMNAGSTGSFSFQTFGSSLTTVLSIGSYGQLTTAPQAFSQSAWGATGAFASYGASTVTDSSTAASGTAALESFISIAAPTLAATNTGVTTTEAATFYIGGAPTAGTNQTITRAHSLAVVNSTSAASSITGGFVIANTLGTAATSTGIGNGNVVTGGNLFASTSTGRVGYLTGTGAGTAVTQLTSRTTAVTSNTPCGAITLFTAAGSATPASFTVNCTAISAGDTVQYAVTSGGTNQYHFDTTAISAGTSFTVTFYAVSGTASDTPVVNYTIIKGTSN